MEAAYREAATGAFLARDEDGFWTAWLPEGDRVFRREPLPLPTSADDDDALRVFENVMERKGRGDA